MIKLILGCLLTVFLFAGSVGATTHTVTQVGLLFVPANITVEQGDTVVWVWTSGSHTVTSGTGLFDPDSGLLFDVISDIANPSFSYTFDLPVDDYPYYCIPHFFLGMTGTVSVTEGQPTSTENTSWGDIKKLFASSDGAE